MNNEHLIIYCVITDQELFNIISEINTNTIRCQYLQKYNMFVAQIGCAILGVLALSLFGPGWLARGVALSASITFMTITGASHPPGNPPTECLI